MLEKFRIKILQKKGQKLLVKGKIQKAYHFFQKVVLLDNSTENIFNLGLALLGLNRFAEAEQHFHKIHEHFPENELNTLSYAESILMQRKWEDAIPLFRYLSENNPKNRSYQYYYQISENVIAREKYVRAKELLNSARQELNKKDNEQALKYLLDAVEYNDKNPVLLNNLASLYILKKDYKNAEKFLQKAVLLDANNEKIQKNLLLVKRKLRK